MRRDGLKDPGSRRRIEVSQRGREVVAWHRFQDPRCVRGLERGYDFATEAGQCASEHSGCSVRWECSHDLGSLPHRQSADEVGDFAGRKAPDSAGTGPEHDPVAATGNEMNIPPRNAITWQVPSQPSQSKSSSHTGRAGLDSGDVEAVQTTEQTNIGDPGKRPPGDVENLSVQHVSAQEEFMIPQGHGSRGGVRRPKLDHATFEIQDCLPGRVCHAVAMPEDHADDDGHWIHD